MLPAIYCPFGDLHYNSSFIHCHIVFYFIDFLVKFLVDIKWKIVSVLEKKAVIRAEKDKAKMGRVFLELDTDADGL